MSARRVTGALLCLLLAGCSSAGVNPANPEVPANPDSTPGATRTPGAVSADQRFTFDEIAEYPDGLEIELAGSVATRAEAKDRGAESTRGEMVAASIRIGNNTELPYDATRARVVATYGGGTSAPLVLDDAGELQRGFTGTIPAGDEAIAPMGFAIPVAALGKVTFTVDPSDNQHEPVSFTGKVERG